MEKQKTFWHLQKNKKIPSPYEVATTDLLYYTKSGFEINVPVADWYERYQENSIINTNDINDFSDPRQTIYSTYVDLQKEKEAHVKQTLEIIERTQYDKTLQQEWLNKLNNILPQLRFVFHGLQMVASYIGHMAPNSRLIIALAFQAADEMRRTQHVAYRIRQIQFTHPEFGTHSKQKWQSDKNCQPLRRTIEELFIVYDWFEALVILNLIVKPVLDCSFMIELPKFAKEYGDFQLANIFSTLFEDCQWHSDWSKELLSLAVKQNPKIKPKLANLFNDWNPKILDACQMALSGLDGQNQIAQNCNSMIEDFLEKS